MPEPNSMMLLGSGVVPVVVVLVVVVPPAPSVNASEGILPRCASLGLEGPEFSSQ